MNETGGEFAPGEEKEGRIYYEAKPDLEALEQSLDFVKIGFTFGSESILDEFGNESENGFGVMYEILLY